MNYIPFPRQDKDAHTDLINWRANAVKKEGEWTGLRTYLAQSCRLKTGIHTITKCWYSELHQGDNYALDVEHYRPKNAAQPLSNKYVTAIEKTTGEPLLQDSTIGYSYPWLKFEYRNYRVVTALTNRTGAKHIYFPIFNGTNRLAAGTFPWTHLEFPLFLDPTNKHDAKQLLVQPNGEIIPRAAKTSLTQNEINNLPGTWQNDSFNYIRAVVTIKMFRLDDTIFVQGRKEVYDKVRFELETLLYAINSKAELIIKRLLEQLSHYLLPSAQFSLAAKCAMIDFIPDSKFGKETIEIFNNAVNSILDDMELTVDLCIVNWTRP